MDNKITHSNMKQIHIIVFFLPVNSNSTKHLLPDDAGRDTLGLSQWRPRSSVMCVIVSFNQPKSPLSAEYEP